MKYGKSAFPYLALLLVILIVLPLTSRQFQKSQEITVEIKIQKKNNTSNQLVKAKKKKTNSKKSNLLSSN